MRLLIDTQVFVWLVTEDKRLGMNTRRKLEDMSNQLYTSYFSFFEMTIKASIGKMDYNAAVLEDLPKMGIELLLPDKKSLQGYAIFSPDNKDPFDNMLISIARSEKCTFVTSDTKILTVVVPGLKLIDATE